jgi:hypothetical protein
MKKELSMSSSLAGAQPSQVSPPEDQPMPSQASVVVPNVPPATIEIWVVSERMFDV